MSGAMLPGCASVVLVALSLSAPARAFPYIVQQGDTLARIADRVYGDTHMESVIAGANVLDRSGGIALSPGMRIEVPADLNVRAEKGDTWAALAARWLGQESHANELAAANQGVPWIPPEAGQNVRVFAVLTHVAGPREFVSGVAKHYGMDPKTSWKLALYNKHDGDELEPGERITVPLAHVSLTAAGRAMLAEASEAGLRAAGVESAGRPTVAESMELLRRLRMGEWAGAVELGARFTRVVGPRGQRARALGYRVLLEAYAATGEAKRARAACTGLKQNVQVDLNETWWSPGLRALCTDMAQ